MADTVPETHETEEPPPGGGWPSNAVHAGAWIANFFKTQFTRAWFWGRVILMIQFGITFLGMLMARLGDEDAGRLHVALAGLAVALLSNIVWGELVAVGLVAGAAEPAVRGAAKKIGVDIDPVVEKTREYAITTLFSIAAIMVALDCAVVAFEMWTDFGKFALFLLLSLGMAYGASAWSATRVWLPRIQKGTLIFEGILVAAILVTYLFPAQFGWARVIYSRESVIQKTDNRENANLIKSLGSEYDRLATERTGLVLRRIKNVNPEARISAIDERQTEIRQQLATVGGDGPSQAIGSWASSVSTTQGWGRARWAMAALITLLLGFGCFTLAKQKKIWPLVVAFLLILFIWPMARWMDGETSATQTIKNAVGTSQPTTNPSAGVTVPAPTPIAVPTPMATAKSESVLWPEVKTTDATQTGNKWEFGLDSRVMNETKINVPDVARLRATVTGTVRPDKDLATVTADSGWSISARAVHKPEQFPLPSGRFGQPLLVVGDTVYPLDGETNLTIAKGGNLSFLVNDRGGLFADNTGTYKVTVELAK